MISYYQPVIRQARYRGAAHHPSSFLDALNTTGKYG